MADHEPAQSTVLDDNAKVRITEWRFAPNAHTGWHQHELDYVVVPMRTGTLEMIDEYDQGRLAELTAGRPYTRNAGVAHDVVNNNEYEFIFIEVELKNS